MERKQPTSTRTDFGWLRAILDGRSAKRATPANEQVFACMTLLNCTTLRVEQFYSDLEYVALSYVVGGNPSEATDAELEDLRNDNDEDDLASVVPRTIRDAIEFTLNLRKNYLWVDRYCISSESPTIRNEQMGLMAEVYQHAWVTLVAIGPDHNAPLPGLSIRKPLSFCYIKDGSDKVVMWYSAESIDLLVARSAYATRAWCLSECLLSRRLVYCLDPGVAVVLKDGLYADPCQIRCWTGMTGMRIGGWPNTALARTPQPIQERLSHTFVATVKGTSHSRPMRWTHLGGILRTCRTLRFGA